MKKSPKGIYTLASLTEAVSKGKIETVILAFADHYGRMMGKRFEADFFIDEVGEKGTHACNYLLTTDMEMEPVGGYDFANWELGYGDFHLVPDFSTIRKLSWMSRTALIICDLEDQDTHKAVPVSPRQILKRQLHRLAETGFEAQAASELEYYTFNDTYREAWEKGYQNLEPTGWYLEDYHILQGSRMEYFTARARKHLKRSGICVENSKGEWGLGQHELNVRYAPLLDMADQHMVFKHCLKEVAEQCGLSLTFMAKPFSDRAGSSCHIHISLWKDGRNVFAGEEQFGPIRCSEIFKKFLAGCLTYAPDVLPFFAPTVNSYKRYVDGSWAPTRLAWSHDNRTAGFRVVGEGSSLRIETRIPGADVNPYLAYAGLLASGIAGLDENLAAPDVFEGDVYAAGRLPRIAYSLEEATAFYRHSEMAKASFGDDVINHYCHFYAKEYGAYRNSVSDWERRRYFERI